MFVQNTLQDQINAIAEASSFENVHFAIRKNESLKALVCLAEEMFSTECPLRVKLEGKARQRASCVLRELIRHTQSGENIFHLV